VPKILALYKNALGLLPDLITNSKMGNTSNNSGKGSGSAGPGALRSLKDFINTVRDCRCWVCRTDASSRLPRPSACSTAKA
jgi:hypothetical protein